MFYYHHYYHHFLHPSFHPYHNHSIQPPLTPLNPSHPISAERESQSNLLLARAVDQAGSSWSERIGELTEALSVSEQKAQVRYTNTVTVTLSATLFMIFESGLIFLSSSFYPFYSIFTAYSFSPFRYFLLLLTLF